MISIITIDKIKYSIDLESLNNLKEIASNTIFSVENDTISSGYISAKISFRVDKNNDLINIFIKNSLYNNENTVSQSDFIKELQELVNSIKPQYSNYETFLKNTSNVLLSESLINVLKIKCVREAFDMFTKNNYKDEKWLFNGECYTACICSGNQVLDICDLTAGYTFVLTNNSPLIDFEIIKDLNVKIYPNNSLCIKLSHFRGRIKMDIGSIIEIDLHDIKAEIIEDSELIPKDVFEDMNKRNRGKEEIVSLLNGRNGNSEEFNIITAKSNTVVLDIPIDDDFEL